MTHDLLRDLFETVGAEILDVVIDELREAVDASLYRNRAG